jgi:hypothetical protein
VGYELRRQLREALSPDITGLQRAVALEIADDANAATRRSFATLDDLARWTGAKDAVVVRNALKRLAAAGWEFRVPIGKGKDGRVMYAVPGTRMTFMVPDFEGVAVAPPKEEHGLPHGGAVATPQGPKGVAVAHSEGAGATPFSSYSSTTNQRGRGSEGYPLEGGDAFTRCQPLIQAMTDAGITVSWQMPSAQWIEINRVVQRAGVEAMVAFAKDTARTARDRPRYASFFVRGWLGLPPRSTRSAPANGAPRELPPHCGQCDPDSRLREVIRDGLPELTPCPDCHPTIQGAHP